MFKGPKYALTPSKTALTTGPTQVIVRCILKLPAHARWQHWQRSRCSRLHAAAHRGRNVVDDMVVHLGRFSCISRLAAWQQSTEPDVQQLPAASRRVRTLRA